MLIICTGYSVKQVCKFRNKALAIVSVSGVSLWD